MIAIAIASAAVAVILGGAVILLARLARPRVKFERWPRAGARFL
jgi:hypothetical protein